ncbi:hypothetical protein BOW53_05155 [Solemya pervernicosa gill symbiont]|uniref:Methyl-accepting chemotaxis protein n=2 Tax=Gammaproteobacteria incertae sedis TaxID=118884 RepID=A0A1T2L7N8_9GAMM|nr:methyl-accepting chemotaxis protein [Candidatus Reidiella endopervernicosa]OOZ41119.1 hypothetical protein BOW53_05155 [Solemya pervernicosa gill symbiont]QKQ26282.1 HAMP domain-containing protein [Candidatus Reidiella endopervernicosa]
MTLRARFTSISIISTILTALIVFFAGQMLLEDAEGRFNDATVRGKSVLWSKIVANRLSGFETAIADVTRDHATLEALMTGNGDVVKESLDTTHLALSSAGILEKLAILDLEGNVIYAAGSSFSGRTQVPLFQDAIAEEKIMLGMVRDDDGDISNAVAFPLYLRGKLLGIGLYLKSLQSSIDDFQRNDSSEVFVYSEAGEVELVGGQNFLSEVAVEMPALGERIAQILDDGDDIYTVSIIPVSDYTGIPFGHLVIAHNSTEAYAQRKEFQEIEYSVIVITILLAAVILLWYIRRSFLPLDELIYVSKRIAAGETTARVDIKSTDEIGKLGYAFNNMAQRMQSNIERERETTEVMHGKVETILNVVIPASEGDLTGEMMSFSGDDSIDHLGCSIAVMISNLEALVAKVQESGFMVGSSATQIAATSKQHEAAVTEQAATTTQIKATVSEISTTARELLDTMSNVTQVSEETANAATDGQSALMSMEETMHHMMEATSAISAKLAVLSEKAGNINSVVTTITKVADQTNLLSLNAAIEAEKAGEYGAGFSVVATEIRRLADQTAVATWDIEQMVKEMQSAVSSGVMGMDKFSDEVRQAVENVHQVGSQLAQIIDQVQMLTPSFEQVHDGMQSQSLGAEQINDAMSQLSDVAQNTAESLRQSGTVITQLNDAARGLQDGVSRFKVKKSS